MKFPAIAEIALSLLDIQKLSETEVVEVRLQLFKDSTWRIHTGLSDYDLDHHGFWGGSAITREMTEQDLQGIAQELIEQATEDFHQRDEE